jgi:6-phosphofructokinase
LYRYGRWPRARPQRRHPRRRQFCHCQGSLEGHRIPDGFDGLIGPQRALEQTLKSVSGILPHGGTILGTTDRGNPFQDKSAENGQECDHDISDPVTSNAKKPGMDAIITVGGDGSHKIALELFRKGMRMVAVPKTIDNDLCGRMVWSRHSRSFTLS